VKQAHAELLLSPHAVVRSGLCIGCGSCVGQSDATGPRMEMDRYGLVGPAGPTTWFSSGSARLARTCPFSPAARNEDELASDLYPDAPVHPPVGRYTAAYVGYAADNGFRDRGSSGGMVSWVLAELLRAGLVDGVAHVAPTDDPQTDGRFFRYRISRTEEEVHAGAKSRYYPVELSDVLRTIRAVPGRYAVVGVPCFVKAVQLLRREDPLIRERVAFTLGLFCGHMKSARFVESFAWQMAVPVEDVQRVEFRLKDVTRPASTYTAELTLRDGRTVKRDWWNLADGDWGAGFFQSAACNFCDDVVAETADVSFGDAWVEPYSSDGRGTNVVVVRSPLVADLVAAGIRQGRLQLHPVDSGFVEQTQAAGFRQRREGLAYRLGWPRVGIRPRKRVAPDARAPSARRKLIYRMRALISAWSHRVFLLARLTGRPTIYLRWARAAVAVYHGLAYSRGRLGELVDRLRLH
jgi:coenzyme F420-reducing hydrogenase beta subunit